MTISTEVSTAGPFVGNGVTTVFPFAFMIQNADEVELYVTTTATGLVTKLTYPGEYSVTFVDGVAGGSATALIAPATGTTVAIRRSVEALQEMDLSQLGPWEPETQEKAFDKLTMLAQQNGELAGRAIRVPAGETLGQELPPVATRASKDAIFDSAGNLTAGVRSSPSTTSAAMQPVTEAATLALARAAMGPWGDTLVTATGGTTARSLADRSSEEVNVLDFGADPTGIADSTAAIQAAADTLPAGGKTKCLVFPPGHYKISSPGITIANRGASIRGYGKTTSVLLSVDGSYTVLTCDVGTELSGTFDISDLGITESGAGSFLSTHGLKVVGSGSKIRNNSITIGGIACSIASSAVVQVSDNYFQSIGGNHALRLNTVSGCIANNICRTWSNSLYGNGGRAEAGACFKVTGNPTTSLQIIGNIFRGGASDERLTITSITSNASQFVVTLSNSTTLKRTELFFIEGCATAGYNGTWVVESISGNAITVLSTLNPGAAASGTAARLRACAHVSGIDGPVNECTWIGNNFEGWNSAGDIGAVSLFFDGIRRVSSQCANWHNVGPNFYDYGQIGICIIGEITGLQEKTINSITINGGIMNYAYCGVYLSGCSGVDVLNLRTMCHHSKATASDKLQTSGVHLVASPAGTAEKLTAIKVQGCHFGREIWMLDSDGPNWTPQYGIWLSGDELNDLHIQGNHLYGQTSAVRKTSSAIYALLRARIEGNFYGEGALPLTVSDVIPSVASATSVDLPMHDVVKITGTTNIATITGGWVGRTVHLVFTGALTLATGGNLAIAAGLSILAGQQVTAVFDGSNWYVG